MADQTVVYISGVSKGIGKSLLGHYLSLPNHIVIGSIRDKTAPYVAELTALPTAPGSRLALVRVESTSPTDAVEAVKEAVSTLGIDKIDIVIANAGGARYTEEALVPLHEMTIEWTKEVFDLNTLGPVLLFQATRALLQKSKKPVWVTVSSAAGSIEAIEGYGTHRIPAYGMAKAAVNWATVAMHSGNEWLIALAVHPGQVQSDGGNYFARKMGLEEAPTTLEECRDGLTGLIAKATREESSGKFWDSFEGKIVPW